MVGSKNIVTLSQSLSKIWIKPTDIDLCSSSDFPTRTRHQRAPVSSHLLTRASCWDHAHRLPWAISTESPTPLLYSHDQEQTLSVWSQSDEEHKKADFDVAVGITNHHRPSLISMMFTKARISSFGNRIIFCQTNDCKTLACADRSEVTAHWSGCCAQVRWLWDRVICHSECLGQIGEINRPYGLLFVWRSIMCERSCKMEVGIEPMINIIILSPM